MAAPNRRALRPGVYAPSPTFFNDEQEIDYECYKKHLLNLATRGMVPVCAGSLGEAVHLDFEERQTLIRFIRATLDDAGLQLTPIVAGVGGFKDAGMVILPAYYAASLNADSSQVIQYYVDICEGSPIPILLYNFPANAGGQDMSSEIICSIIKQAPNLCGVKLTCGGSVAKLVRLCATISEDRTINSTRKFPFLLLDGLIADLTPWMKCGGHGTVSGIPNFAPVASMRLWHLLSLPSPSEEESAEAARIQGILSRADVAAVPGGIRAMKYALNRLHGYSIAPRKPLLPLKESDGELFMSALGEMIEFERSMTRSSNIGL
ncbi:dihydrodipicolinate synthase [Penicillium chermesinum]|uniref:Dihydrodipicolinate synthase n=1 Tax=Penicillium chermesinum TaxID=63820 RepID=A0A9W9TI25_9EURO|nr:dihydrodipicolinate synthase [Penicillium chermesinum]KAJ5223652.1 dihydrodipicolinate synthase [Penicillium chermesinum]